MTIHELCLFQYTLARKISLGNWIVGLTSNNLSCSSFEFDCFLPHWTQSRQLFSEDIYLENIDVVIVVVVAVAKGTVSGMLWHSGLNSNFVYDLSKCSVSKLVHTPVTKEEEEASIDYHILSLAKPQKFPHNYSPGQPRILLLPLHSEFV